MQNAKIKTKNFIPTNVNNRYIARTSGIEADPSNSALDVSASAAMLLYSIFCFAFCATTTIFFS
jgi:hypothetical protein